MLRSTVYQTKLKAFMKHIVLLSGKLYYGLEDIIVVNKFMIIIIAGVNTFGENFPTLDKFVVLSPQQLT